MRQTPDKGIEQIILCTGAVEIGFPMPTIQAPCCAIEQYAQPSLGRDSEHMVSIPRQEYLPACPLHSKGDGMSVGMFNFLTAGSLHRCGVRTGGAVKCRGDSSYGQAAPPSRQFVSVSAGTLLTACRDFQIYDPQMGQGIDCEDRDPSRQCCIACRCLRKLAAVDCCP